MGRPTSLRNAAIATVLVCAVVAALGHASHIVLAALGVTTLIVGPALVREGFRQRRLARGLLAVTRPGQVHGIRVRLGPLHGAAFVAGLVHPRIFCDDRLAATLTADELRAVALHERAHQRARDPLRMALFSAIGPLARRLPSGPAWLERQAAEREIAADRAALSRGASRAAIASALSKVGPLHPTGAPGFARAIDLRLAALLDGAYPTGHRWSWTLAGLAVASSLCVVTLLHEAPTVLDLLCC